MVTEAVIDSSVIVALVTLEDRSDWARRKLSEYAYFHILDLNYYEVANAIKYKKSPKFSVVDAENAFAKAIELMNLFGVHSFGDVVVGAISLALEFDLAVYDAALFMLAQQLDLRLVTLDVKLAKKLESTKYYRLLDYPNR